LWPDPASDSKDNFHTGGVSEFSESKFETAKWNDGSASGLRIYDVAAISAEMQFKVGNGPIVAEPTAGSGGGGSGSGGTSAGAAGAPTDGTGGLSTAGGAASTSGGASGTPASSSGGAVSGSGGAGGNSSGAANAPATAPAEAASCACRAAGTRGGDWSSAFALGVCWLSLRRRRSASKVLAGG
jgi:hypothetical protein